MIFYLLYFCFSCEVIELMFDEESRITTLKRGISILGAWTKETSARSKPWDKIIIIVSQHQIRAGPHLTSKTKKAYHFSRAFLLFVFTIGYQEGQWRLVIAFLSICRIAWAIGTCLAAKSIIKNWTKFVSLYFHLMLMHLNSTTLSGNGKKQNSWIDYYFTVCKLIHFYAAKLWCTSWHYC